MDDGEELAVLYRQFDGYLEGHGKDLRDFLKDFEVVNGIGDKTRKIANGMGCLAAQVIAHFKKEVGNFYLYPAGTRDVGEEYVYTLSVLGATGMINLKVQSGDMTFFGLPGTKQADMNVLYDGPIGSFDWEEVKKKEEEQDESTTSQE